MPQTLPLQDTVKILWNEQQAPAYFKMGLVFPELAATATPGQFVMVRVHDSIDPMLRRPFSIHNLIQEGGVIRGFEILYKVVGKGTKILSELRVGQSLSVLGPFGKGFTYPKDLKNVFLVAGGIGVAPLYFLASGLAHIGRHTPFRCTLFFGGCRDCDIICKKGFQALGVELKITTENGSLGYKGVITSVLDKALASGERPDIIYACGPKAMLKEISRIGASYHIPCQFSLEAVMACGFGACLGCAIKGKAEASKYLHVCTDGPIFDPQLIEW